jgi:phage terminase large subunit-like protein
VHNRSQGTLTWHFLDGSVAAIAQTYSGHNPGKLRGPQHHYAWADEAAAWKYPIAWDMLMLGLRLGDHPQVVVTTTPKPVRVIRDLMKDPSCVVTKGSTYDNAANLPLVFFDQIVSLYEGTTLGLQEIHAHLLDDTPGAGWKRETIDDARVRTIDGVVLSKIVVAVDPMVSASSEESETGIVVAGLGAVDREVYVLEDASTYGTPDEWAGAVIDALDRWDADYVVGEVNNGGDLVETVLRTKRQSLAYRAVRASRGKFARAEPVTALYEQARVHHVGSDFHDLEDQMCNWTVDADWSPDRMDALVWAVTELAIRGGVWSSSQVAAIRRGGSGRGKLVRDPETGEMVPRDEVDKPRRGRGKRRRGG